MARLAFLAMTLLTVLIGQAGATDIKIIASGATHDALSKVLSDFEKSTSRKIDVTWAGAAVYRPILSSDKPFDAVIIAASDADAFIKSEKLRAPKLDLAKTGIGVGVRKGQSKPNISTAEQVKATLLQARSIGYSMGPSGAYVEKLVANLGIADEVRPKLRQTKSGREVGKLIASGDVEIGFQPISELVHAEGVDFVGGLPSELQSYTVYSFVIHAQVRDEKVVQELSDFLKSAEVRKAFQSAGMEQP
jgi:molybdate transport system substrate-binding protein